MKNEIYGIIPALIFSAMLTACLYKDKNAADVSRETTGTAYTTVTLGTSLTSVTRPKQTSVSAKTETALSSELTVSTDETTAVTETEFPFEDTIENAYRRLMLSFDTENGTVYPDDFAGVYSFAGTLFVSLTVPEPPAAYTDILDGYTCVRFRSASRSYNELEKAAASAAELLEERFGVAEYYVDAPSNKAAVVIINEDPKSAQNYLKSLSGLDFTLDEIAISMADPEETAVS